MLAKQMYTRNPDKFITQFEKNNETTMRLYTVRILSAQTHEMHKICSNVYEETKAEPNEVKETRLGQSTKHIVSHEYSLYPVIDQHEAMYDRNSSSSE